VSVKKFVPQPVRNFLHGVKNDYFDGYALKSYSQEGEDMILCRIFDAGYKGFYVDVGAHHPKRFSNTFFFYKRGWSGLNIDAMPGSMDAFRQTRPRDINIECGVSDEAGMLKYYIFNEPALNGFSKPLADKRHQSPNYKITAVKDIAVRTLSSIMDDHIRDSQTIDFLTIDVEGFDLQVLRSNNWDKYRPQIVLIEVLGQSLSTIDQDPATQFLTGKGYDIYAKCVNSVFFRRVGH
jgi:FkbM family methyltransferase